MKNRDGNQNESKSVWEEAKSFRQAKDDCGGQDMLTGCVS